TRHVDCSLAVHARRLRRVGIELSAGYHLHAVMFPALDCCHRSSPPLIPPQASLSGASRAGALTLGQCRRGQQPDAHYRVSQERAPCNGPLGATGAPRAISPPGRTALSGEVSHAGGYVPTVWLLRSNQNGSPCCMRSTCSH